ncbi:hypothetical protein HYFRA_00003802 [Hymenoscyphus fraxineus]|uniref:UspA domain-containing protein n=1 Tax=Hymenoscyphus fraxineus TaxID=746836 RepID=A0A9N9PJZ1_9HELO|nr:hypothetical protein HYFRA_00003802 [Hymenoscyphus fraxineus]
MVGMSMESMLDEERRDVLALLEGSSASRPRGSASSASGRESSPFTPRSPIRSMLDIAEDAPPRRASAPRKNVEVAKPVANPPRMGKIRSMLDLDGPPYPSPASGATKSAQASPTQSNNKPYSSSSIPHRSLSDAGSRPAEFGPRSNVLETPKNPSTAYQFAGILTANPGGPMVPRRNTQGGKKSSLPSAMSEVVRGGDLSMFGGPRERGRNHSIASTGISTAKSKSPHNRLGLRSNSPHTSSLSQDSNRFVLNDGRVIDMNSAYRRLSDANLALSGGNLSTLGNRRRKGSSRDGSDPDGGRLEKDYVPVDGEDAVDSSDDDEHTSDDEGTRGRKAQSRGRNREKAEHSRTESHTTIGMGRGKGPRGAAQSLMAAAEEEREAIASRYKVRSLLDPEITVTAPSGTKLKSSKPGVHPNTSFDDQGTTGLNTPVDSDTEQDLTDIKRAQKLSVNMTSITSTPATARCVRTLFRGDFTKTQKEAQENQRRVRKYLVATDLSDEAAHALEWTIGTVLRDGDTLLAIYCVDEELGIETMADEAHMREQVVAVGDAAKSTASTPVLAPVTGPSPLGPGFRLETNSASASPMGRHRDKAEQDRYRAVQDITDRVSKLLRKTKLQVKVVIEVIHCKSPKHLITEVIDYISPTLVILGSRGRSALKGVILGSFSNYLVTKSSAPVMVARKRLRKHTKYKRPTVRLANNLASPVKSLEKARID